MNEWIKSHGKVSENELLGCITGSSLQEGKYLAFYTDRVECGYFEGGFHPSITDTKHLLEIRVFNRNSEYKAVRDSMGKAFIWRIADDDFFRQNLLTLASPTEKEFKKRVFKEQNYLDIDTTKGFDFKDDCICVKATGGGRYCLPTKEKVEKIVTQSYLNYAQDDGSIIVADWRVVGFGKEE